MTPHNENAMMSESSPYFWNRLKKPIIGLSPMDGVTDPCFRRIMAMHGRPDLIMTEFLSVEGIFHGARNALFGLSYHKIERPILAQLYGPNPETFFHVAQLVCELGFDGLDINMGCPSKKVSSLGSGAALIKDPPRAKAIIEAARQGIERWVGGAPLTICKSTPMVADWLSQLKDKIGKKSVGQRKAIPVSVKTRIGVDRIVIKDWIRHLLDVRPVAISIHGRTLRQGYRGEADWDQIAEAVEIARDTETLILGNGDLSSLNDVIWQVHQTEVDGVLIGRAAMGNPWIFHRKEMARALLQHGDISNGKEGSQLIQEKPIDYHARFSIALQHARLFEAMNGQQFFNGMRKHLGFYCRNFDGARALRTKMVRTNNADEVSQIINTFLSEKRANKIHESIDRSEKDAQLAT